MRSSALVQGYLNGIPKFPHRGRIDLTICSDLSRIEEPHQFQGATIHMS